jgi:RNA-directed DNA polymerase
VNESKSAVAKPQQRKFLGFSFTGGQELKRKIAPKAIDRFKERVREITLRSCGMSMKQMLEELAGYVRGWNGYFGFCQTPTVFDQLNSWLRRRVRCAFWRQWKTGRKRYAELVQRGVSRQLASDTAGSRCGPWRVSQSPALDRALPNVYLHSIGVPLLVVR